MNFFLLFRDELTGFYKSNVMLILWLGLPLLAILSFLFFPANDELPMSFIASSIISGIGGFLAALMLAVHIIHEKSRHVYELFLIRPVKRSHIILAKFFAVFLCVALASILAISLGFTIDHLFLNRFSAQLFKNTIESVIISLSIIAIECAAGALVGVLASSVIFGVILVVITHNIASLTVLLPIMNKATHPVLMAVLSGFLLSAFFLITAIRVFRKKQF
jgi:ABC-2 type transport system permease protein